MLDRLKQLNKLWKLSKKDKKFLKALEETDYSQLDAVPDEDTKPIFMGDMTEDEYATYVRENVEGWKAVDDMVRKILKHGK